MATLTLRLVKNQPLTNAEVDGNFTNLNNDKVEKSGDTLTGKLTFLASIAGSASLNLPSGANPTSPANGDVWNNSGILKFRHSDTTYNVITSADNQSFSGAVNVGGNLTVDGGTTTINSTTVTIRDKNVSIGNVASPDNSSAEGGGFTLRGTTDKTFQWSIGYSGTTGQGANSFNSSESLNIIESNPAEPRDFKINGVSVLTKGYGAASGQEGTLGQYVVNSSLKTLGTITTGVWNGTPVAIQYGGTGATTEADALTNLGIGPASHTRFSSLGLGVAASGVAGRIDANFASLTSDIKFVSATQVTGLLSNDDTRVITIKNTGPVATGLSVGTGVGSETTPEVNKLKVGPDITATTAGAFSAKDGTFSDSITLSGSNKVFTLTSSNVKFSQATGYGIKNSSDALALEVRSDGIKITSLGVGTTPGASGEIRASSEITAYYSSDIRLKENVTNITSALDKLNKLNGVEFDWTQQHLENRGGEDGYFVRKHDIGVIAQEVEKVLPEIVASRDDGYKAVRYEKIIPLLIEAIKELHTQVKELKNA